MARPLPRQGMASAMPHERIFRNGLQPLRFVPQRLKPQGILFFCASFGTTEVVP